MMGATQSNPVAGIIRTVVAPRYDMCRLNLGNVGGGYHPSPTESAKVLVTRADTSLEKFSPHPSLNNRQSRLGVWLRRNKGFQNLGFHRGCSMFEVRLCGGGTRRIDQWYGSCCCLDCLVLTCALTNQGEAEAIDGSKLTLKHQNIARSGNLEQRSQVTSEAVFWRPFPAPCLSLKSCANRLNECGAVI